MKTVTGLLFVVLLLASTPLLAQTAESQPYYKWVASPCDTWGCAVAAMADGKGDPYVIVLPTKSTAYPWIVLKRMEAGVVELPAGPQVFAVETFGSMLEASIRFGAIEHEKIPILVTTTDGGMLVIQMQGEEPTKRRAVRPR